MTITLDKPYHGKKSFTAVLRPAFEVPSLGRFVDASKVSNAD